MKNQLRQIFQSPKFVIGFVMFVAILLTAIFYPIFVKYDPLEMVGGLFYKPGTYVSVQDSMEAEVYKLDLDTSENKLNMALAAEDKVSMKEWLVKFAGLNEADIDVEDAAGLVQLWHDNYDSKNPQKGLIAAKKKYYSRLDTKIAGILENTDVYTGVYGEDGTFTQDKSIGSNAYVNTKDIPNQRTFLMGTDNFGRDVLTELVSAIGTSLKIGLIAGAIATLIGLTLGLLAGYVGGVVDDMITFVTNLFTVIPSFIILILISYSIGASSRGIVMVAVIIGLTSWTWTTRSVRSQVISLRNRDHVNLSKLSGHSMTRIILTDILPYVASYVVMALILQISSGILAEAQLSMLGLGPATTTVSTLGLMMNWAMTYKAPLSGAWWAYLPVILSIALISFSLNLMNTGLDQVFNPQLRD